MKSLEKVSLATQKSPIAMKLFCAILSSHASTAQLKTSWKSDQSVFYRHQVIHMYLSQIVTAVTSHIWNTLHSLLFALASSQRARRDDVVWAGEVSRAGRGVREGAWMAEAG